MKLFCPSIIDSDLLWREDETHLQRLSRWANIYGNFKVAYSFRDKEGDHHFSKHRSILECMETDWGIKFLQKANHRQILPIELVLDLDEKPTLKKINHICDELDKLECVYYCYSTGSKGYHIHIFDYDLINNQHAKTNRRNSFNVLFGCDELKNSERVMIAMENKPHWKTGNKKTRIRQCQVN